MATVSDGWRISANFGGLDDSTQTMTGEMTATLYADVVTDAAIVLTAWQGVSAGTLRGYDLTQRFINDAYVRPSSTDAEGNESAFLITGIEGNPFKKASISIPFPKLSIFLDTVGENRNKIDISDADIGILVAKYSTGGQLYISDGEIADSAIRGERD